MVRAKTMVHFGLAALVAACLAGCGSNNGGGVGDGDGGTNANGDAAIDDSGMVVTIDGGVVVTEDGGGTWVCHVVQCAAQPPLECGDCIDNDGDGLVDSHDPECLGPCDNTEGPALNAGVGGETGGPCKADCYFDFGNGSGNDDCYWDHRCDPLAVAPDYPPEGEDCEYDPSMIDTRDCPANQSTQCLDYCIPITPNGCDCFGCCTFPALEGLGPNGGPGYVWIGHLDNDNNGTCTFAGLTDPGLCPPCTPVLDCLNECGYCELCLGMTELPPECTPDDRCPEGIPVCGLPDDPPCPTDWYCVTGCCTPPVV